MGKGFRPQLMASLSTYSWEGGGRGEPEALNLLFPFVMLYLTNHIAYSLFPSFPLVVPYPQWGGKKSGAQTPRAQKLCLRNSVAHA